MNEQLRILLCEDDENLGNILRELLASKGFSVDLHTDGEAGRKAFMSHTYDLCLLDIMMPKRDGLTLAKDIRSVNADVPIIFLTAMGMRENVLEGFRAGADDYITKPFSLEELMLRIEAILRRTHNHIDRTPETQAVYQIGNYTFDTMSQRLTIGDSSQRLTTKENELLSLLCAFANHTLERSHALQVIWGISDDNVDADQSFSQRSMDVYVTKLRRMLRQDPRVEIKNVHGKGYKLIIPSEAH
ncbi:response regulator transcription factor [Porphyromonas sp. COT-239 OH1446]|uniref:response regulator transcription factor n=1 Tax=Porphyromonas sp. COT-239 OH1446 TaxID=1515613 RepID=UPI00052D763C|nr:response regulator transcription factor [Porphyromonas sp. COT-239 OH1446]KGN72183.1 transcriptional regulator [Porphyromonas sp. COT-239 OH1446]